MFGLVLLVVGALSGRNEAAGQTMFGVGLILLVCALIAVGIVLIRGDKGAERD